MNEAAGDLSEALEILKQELERKNLESEGLQRLAEELKTQNGALRSDFSVQDAERVTELGAMRDLLEVSAAEAKSLEKKIMDLNLTQKQLKAQNLNLQYHLNLWGIPVQSMERDGKGDFERDMAEGKAFFPALSPLAAGIDPIPVVLQGDLHNLYFPDLFHFLANSNLAGVLTVVTDGVVSKIYLDKGILRLAGWNRRDHDLSLWTLLHDSRVVPDSILADYRELPLHDLELATRLSVDRGIPAETIQQGLREHTRVIISFLMELKRGAFFFQPGRVGRKQELHFQLPIIDVLLMTAAEVDERTRVLNLQG